MTTATTEGRRLVLRVDGIDEPFLVDPLPAKRGRALTELFARASRSKITGEELPEMDLETIFIESLGPANYSRMTGLYVDEFDAEGDYVRTHTQFAAEVLPSHADMMGTARFIARERMAGEAELDGEPIRQEECESLALCAFYWQSVVGIEAVNAFIGAGEGLEGSLKALNLLSIRIGISPSTNSSSQVMESLIQEESSRGTNGTSNSSGSVRLPANKRSFMQNPMKRKPTPHR